jgi:tRNA(Ile)-lysidine synthase
VLEQFLNHIQRHSLCKTTDKILLAVSGGIDSMVMLHLFRCTSLQIGVVHCNFQLRGKDSTADEALVAGLCQQYGIPFHVTKFDTKKYGEDHSLSTQMAARALRYSYFESLLVEHQYDYLATAHHLNDVLETVLLNLVRGSGIEGLSGIPVKNNKIIRPLLFATREQILAYATENDVQWREDVSNDAEEYQRNFLRHQVIPRLKEINPNLHETFRNTSERLAGANALLKTYLQGVQREAFDLSHKQITITKKNILESTAPAVLLWELIKDRGFNFEQCQDMVKEHQPGKQFHSDKYVFTVDRQHFLILPRENDKNIPSQYIQIEDTIIENDKRFLDLTIVEKAAFRLNTLPSIAQVDVDKIKYPLVWRAWKAGDYFIPLGMRQSKKLSDFLIDLKLPSPQKEKITVIESDGTIIWVVGLRIHDHFKVTDGTKRVLTINLRES